jgi:hypothetical protein
VSAAVKKVLSIPRSVTIYRQERSAVPDLSAVCAFLKTFAPWLEITVRDSPLISIPDEAKQKLLAERFARARITNPEKFTLNEKPFPADFQFEMRLLWSSSDAFSCALYSGLEMIEILRDILPREEWSDFSRINAVFTDRAVATSEKDGRAHIRYAVFGVPVIISVAGMVLGPAKPREYYLTRNALSAASSPALAAAYARRILGREFLLADDSRLTAVACNITAQALFFYLVGNPFCEHKSCILFNAHTQADLLRRRRGLCRECQTFLARVRKEACAL